MTWQDFTTLVIALGAGTLGWAIGRFGVTRPTRKPTSLRRHPDPWGPR